MQSRFTQPFDNVCGKPTERLTLTYLDQPLGIIHDGPEARDGRRKLLLEVADHEHGVLGGEVANLTLPRCCHPLLRPRHINIYA